MSSLIKLDDISKIYQTGNTTLTALNHVNLTISSKEMLAIIGVSGSGKSTLMNIIGLLDKPTSGQFFLYDKEISTFNENELAGVRNRSIGFVFQSFFLLPRLTAEQNVAIPLLYRGINLQHAKELAKVILEKVGIAHLRTHKPNQMSGGEQQRIAIARALIGEPDVILADEPTGSLDTKTGQEILDLFIKLNDVDKKTVIIISHDPNISKQCKRVISLEDGQVISDENSNSI